MHLSRILEWYQDIIGHYDKQSWETTVEQRILRGIGDVPKKNAKLKTDFIDVDLIRGSTFPKAKPQKDLWLSGCQGVMRLCFLPFYWKWWIKETSLLGFCIVLGTFFSVGVSSTLYILHSDCMKMVPPYEVYMPAAMLVLLSIMQSQIACTKRPHYLNRKKTLPAKRTTHCSKRPRTPRRVPVGREDCSYRYKRHVLHQPRKQKRGSRSFSEELIRIQLKSEHRSASEGTNLDHFEDYFDANRPDVVRESEGSSVSESTSNYFVPNDITEQISAGISSFTSSEGAEERLSVRYRGKRTQRDRISPVKYKCTLPKTYESSSQPQWADDEPSDDEKSCLDRKPSFLSNVPFKNHFVMANMFSDWLKSSNGDDASYSSESDAGLDDFESDHYGESVDWQIQGAPAAVIPQSTPQVTGKVSCNIWEDGEVKKVNLSVLDISSIIVSKVDKARHDSTYFKFGLLMAMLIAFVPSMHRVFVQNEVYDEPGEEISIRIRIFGDSIWSAIVIGLSAMNRLVMVAGFLFFLSVAERTFRQRFLHSKYFCYLTSARRARKYDVPHFRLNKVVNIKAWLSVRSCLKKCGPQRSVDVIVSVTFIVTLVLVSYLCIELLKEDERTIPPLKNFEFFVWCLPVSIFLIRFMTLGAAINKKYANPSTLVMEQINMYLHMEKKPQKKEELMVANNVLKLVSVLLKELDNPFKISGISANPLLYNVTKFVILSACSAVLSDLLGFKLKLHRIKFH